MALSKEQKAAVKKIKKLYLEDYKNIFKKDKRIDLLNKIVRLADLHELKAYYYWAIGVIENLNGNLVEAIAQLEMAINLDNKLQFAFSEFGRIYFTMEEFEKATESYTKAVLLDEKDILAWFGLGNTLFLQQKYEDAKKSFLKGILFDEDDEYSDFNWTGLGDTYCLLDKYEDAIEAYKNAIDIDEDYTYPWVGLGDTYSLLNLYDEASLAYTRAGLLYNAEDDMVNAGKMKDCIENLIEEQNYQEGRKERQLTVGKDTLR